LSKSLRDAVTRCLDNHPTMTDQQLRNLQDDFLKELEESGFFGRNKDASSVPLFDKHSPTVIQVQRDLWPGYARQFEAYVKERRARTDTKPQSRPAYFRHHGKIRPDPEGPGEVKQERPGQPVRKLLRRNPTGQGGKEVSAVPDEIRKLLRRNRDSDPTGE
jgi:hypothetical protein